MISYDYFNSGQPIVKRIKLSSGAPLRSSVQQCWSVPQLSSVFKDRKTILTRILTEMTGLSLDRKEVYIRKFLQFGADPNLEEDGRDSTLMHAIKLEDHRLVKALIEAGANVNHIGEQNLTALHSYFIPNQSTGEISFLNLGKKQPFQLHITLMSLVDHAD